MENNQLSTTLKQLRKEIGESKDVDTEEIKREIIFAVTPVITYTRRRY